MIKLSPHDKEVLMSTPKIEDDLIIIQRYFVVNKTRRSVLSRMYEYGMTDSMKNFIPHPELGFKKKSDAIEYKTKIQIYFKQIREKHLKQKKSKSSIKFI